MTVGQGRPGRRSSSTRPISAASAPRVSFDGARRRLDHLVELGVTALELMPIADFEGRMELGL